MNSLEDKNQISSSCYQGLAGQDSRHSLIASTKGNILLKIGKHLWWQVVLIWSSIQDGKPYW